MKKFLAMALSLVMVFSMAACSTDSTTDETTGNDTEGGNETTEGNDTEGGDTTGGGNASLDGSGLKLGFILGSREHAFYVEIEKGINAAAADYGFEAIVLESELSGAVASERIETLVVDGVNAISLACNEPAGVTNAIEVASQEGMPMFTFDCTTEETDVILSFVGTDNYQGGVVGGEATIKLLQDMGMTDGATIGVIGYPEPQSCIDRENGWMSVVQQYEEEYNLTIVNVGNYEGEADKAQNIMSDALISYPDMAVVFTVGDPACIGALASIKTAGASTKIIGFDANPEFYDALADAEDSLYWVADVAQDPYRIGYEISEQMLKYLLEGQVDSDVILIEPYLVDSL